MWGLRSGNHLRSKSRNLQGELRVLLHEQDRHAELLVELIAPDLCGARASSRGAS